MALRNPAALFTALLMLGACAATETTVAKRNLDVQTKMSDTVFLDPVRPAERTVFIEVRNTSDKQDLEIAEAVRARVAERGYMITEDPSRAQFMLQANVLQAGRNSETAAEAAYKDGFGSVLTGGAAGAGVGWALGKAGGHDGLLIAGGAILGAGIATVVDAFVQDVTYSVVADLQVSERANADEIVIQDESFDSDQGSSGVVSQSSNTTSPWKRYRTRVVSVAEKVNLEWYEAAPSIVDGMTRSIAGIF